MSAETDHARVRIESRPTVVGLPRTMYVEYFGALHDGTEFIIYRPREGWEYKDFRCLLRMQGAPDFVLTEILQTTRYRDGGTTDVLIGLGQFHFPSPFRREQPTFCGKPLVLEEKQ